MRFIQKSESPAFFEECKETMPSCADWNYFHKNHFLVKKTLKKTLHQEQGGLCVYCEKKIDLSKKSSHFEHIFPKDRQGAYAHLVFDYRNLSISCNGEENESPHKSKEYCGHKKLNFMDEGKFLNPTQQNDIKNYFFYKVIDDVGDQVAIQSSGKDNEKANYMIDELLSLNNITLMRERAYARKQFLREFIVEIKSNKKDRVVKYLKKNPAFVSLLSSIAKIDL